MISLAEWEQRLVRNVSLSERDRKLAAQLGGSEQMGRVDIDELHDGVRIRTRSWVGVLCFEQFSVRIVPKLVGGNPGLLDMLAFNSGLRALRSNRSRRTLPGGDNASLFDLLALLLADAAERVVQQGLLYGYVQHEDALPVLRGRLRVSEQVRTRFGQLDRLECRYDDHSSNIAENQLIAAALEACYGRVEDAGVRQRIHRLHTVFHKVCDLSRIDLSTLLEPVHYHRLNAYYQQSHELARLILGALGIDDLLSLGRLDSFAFLLDMNRLFEQFVEKVVRQLLQGEVRVQGQYSDSSILWDVTRQQPYGRIRPDLLLEGYGMAAPRLAVDAKYKLYDERKLSSADIFQTFLYAFAYTDADRLPRGLIVFPANTERISSKVIRVHHRSARRLAQIEAIGLHLPAVLAELRGKPGEQLDALRETCLRALQPEKMVLAGM